VLVAATTTDFPIGFRNAVVTPALGTNFSKRRHFIAMPEYAVKTLGAYNNDLPNLSQAVERRVFTVERSTDNGKVYVECPKPIGNPFVRINVDDVLKHFDMSHAARMDYASFLKQCPAHARSGYAKAIQQNIMEGVRKSHSWIFPFVKYEKVDISKACRLISPRHKRYNVELGRYTRAIEEEMYRALSRAWGDDEDNLCTVAKGMTVVQIAAAIRSKWEMFVDPVAVGLDASRFDQHVSRQALQYEHQYYNKLFNCGFLRRLLSWQLKNHFVVKLDGFKYEFDVDGTRMSGDMNTALGNCILMCTLVLKYVSELGIKAKLINNGDDCVVFMERSDVDRFIATLDAWFLEFGFEMKVEPMVDVFEEIEFCQMHPVHTTEWVMVRSPAAALTKDVMSLGSRSTYQYLQWLRAVGQCGYSLYGDMPVYSSFYRSLVKLGLDSNIRNNNLLSNSGFFRLSRLPRIRNMEATTITDNARLSFQRAFGVTVREQRELETCFENSSIHQELQTALMVYPQLHILAHGIL